MFPYLPVLAGLVSFVWYVCETNHFVGINVAVSDFKTASIDGISDVRATVPVFPDRNVHLSIVLVTSPPISSPK